MDEPAPPPARPPVPPAGHGPGPHPVPAGEPRHLELADLPADLVRKLSFERAAPRRLRRADLPAETREVVAGVWDAIVADVWDELAGAPRRTLFDRERMAEVLGRVADTAQQGERALIVAAVHHPLPGAASWKQATVAGLGAAGSATVAGVVAVGSAGTGAAVAVAAAVVGELLETYVAASARTHQYRQARRAPDPALVASDLAEALGEPGLADRRVDRELTARALAFLARTLVPRASGRFARALVPVAGAVAAGGMASRDVLRVTGLPLRPPNESEVARMADELRTEPPPPDVGVLDAFAEPTRPPEGGGRPD